MPANKEWRVSFNKDVDPATLTGNIFICEAATGNQHPVTLEIDPDSPSTVVVKLNQPFAGGGSYILYIKNSVRAKNGGPALKQGIMMPFTVAGGSTGDGDTGHDAGSTWQHPSG